MRTLFHLSVLVLMLQSCRPTPSKNTASEQTDLPSPGAWVNDYEHILREDTGGDYYNINKIMLLDSTVKAFENNTGNEITIVTVGDIRPYETLKDYAVALGNKWRVGKKEKNNGLVIAVSEKRREVFIATGKGTEKIINDSICRNIVDIKMIPKFRKGDYYGGINEGLQEIMSAWTRYSRTPAR